LTRFIGYIAMSIDARIADGTDQVDWLTQFNRPDDDYGYADFYRSIDALIMGRATYDFIAAQPKWPYPGKQSYVITSHDFTPDRSDVEVAPPDFDALRARLLAEDDQQIWIVGGGQTMRGALDAGMFDELRLFVMPIVLGSGPLVFSDGPPANAILKTHKVWPGGIVELRYTF